MLRPLVDKLIQGRRSQEGHADGAHDGASVEEMASAHPQVPRQSQTAGQQQDSSLAPFDAPAADTTGARGMQEGSIRSLPIDKQGVAAENANDQVEVDAAEAHPCKSFQVAALMPSHCVYMLLQVNALLLSSHQVTRTATSYMHRQPQCRLRSLLVVGPHQLTEVMQSARDGPTGCVQVLMSLTKQHTADEAMDPEPSTAHDRGVVEGGNARVDADKAAAADPAAEEQERAHSGSGAQQRKSKRRRMPNVRIQNELEASDAERQWGRGRGRRSTKLDPHAELPARASSGAPHHDYVQSLMPGCLQRRSSPVHDLRRTKMRHHCLTHCSCCLCRWVIWAESHRSQR
jgi:hypothetical protein